MKRLEVGSFKVGVEPVTIGSALPVIAVPIVATEVADVPRQWGEACADGADLIEWRLDLLDQIPEREIIASLGRRLREKYGVPVIATVRTSKEGGGFPFDPDEYSVLLASLATWADMVDIELRRDGAEALIEDTTRSAHTIVSYHQFETAPSSAVIKDLLAQMAREGAAVAKVAWMVENAADLEQVQEAARWAKETLPIPSVVIGMGQVGKPTRLGNPALDSAFTFAASAGASAPGQPTVSEVRQSWADHSM